MRPWAYSDHLCLPFQGESGDLLIISELLPRLMVKRFPRELIEMVGSFIGPSVLWRYPTVIKRAASLQLTPAVQDWTRRLCDIQHWSRHQEPVMCDTSSTASCYTRITIDSSGIKGIDRIVAHEQKYDAKPTPYHRFIIEEADKLSEVVACLQVSEPDARPDACCADRNEQNGHCRLKFCQPTRITFLNYPLLPEVTCRVFSALTTPKYIRGIQMRTQPGGSGHLSVIDTASCFGLILFVEYYQILAVHAHTSIAPTALETFLRITSFRGEFATWLYVALPSCEEITALGGSSIDTAAMEAQLYVGQLFCVSQTSTDL